MVTLALVLTMMMLGRVTAASMRKEKAGEGEGRSLSRQMYDVAVSPMGTLTWKRKSRIDADPKEAVTAAAARPVARTMSASVASIIRKKKNGVVRTANFSWTQDDVTRVMAQRRRNSWTNQTAATCLEELKPAEGSCPALTPLTATESTCHPKEHFEAITNPAANPKCPSMDTNLCHDPHCTSCYPKGSNRGKCRPTCCAENFTRTTLKLGGTCELQCKHSADCDRFGEGYECKYGVCKCKLTAPQQHFEGYTKVCYTQPCDLPFHCLLRNKELEICGRSTKGVTGSEIRIDSGSHAVDPEGAVIKDIYLHVPGNTAVSRSDFGKWTRWYQEHGNVQTFRLFANEYSLKGERGRSAPRCEVGSGSSWTFEVENGAWNVWNGTYTIIKPQNAAIFQVFCPGKEWPIHLSTKKDGSIWYTERRPRQASSERVHKQVITNATGSSFQFAVRDDGRQSEVMINSGDGWRNLTDTPYVFDRPNCASHFRWGQYCGSYTTVNGQRVNNTITDSLSFVTGVTITTESK